MGKEGFEEYIAGRKVNTLFSVLDNEWGIDFKTLSRAGDPPDVAEDAGLWHYHKQDGKFTVDCIYVKNIPSSFSDDETSTPAAADAPENCPFCQKEIPEYIQDSYLFAVTQLKLA